VFVAGFIGEPPMNFVRDTVRDGCISFGGQTIDLSRKLKNIGRYEGKEIVFGFRPEAAVLEKCENGYTFCCNVELTEMLGDYTNVYINQNGQQAILKVDSHDTPETDQDLTFSVPMENVYLFDGESEMVIRD
jgi:multiple sugar transport system ATP-binding protein